MTDDRVRRLERRIQILLAIALAPLALSIYLVVRKPSVPRWPNAVGSMQLRPEGIYIETPTPKRKVWGTLTADEHAALVGVGVGPVGITQRAIEGSPIVTWSVTGVVGSQILINTDTGEWTLERSRRDAAGQIIKEDNRQLLPPLPE